MQKNIPLKFICLVAAALSTLVFLAACSSERALKTHLERGENYLKNRQYAEAALEFRSAIDIDKNFAPAHFGLARAYEAQERFAETIEELRKTVELDAGNLEARVKLGNYYLLTQPPNVEEAQSLINQIFGKDANYIEGHILKANLLAVQKKPDAEVLAVLNHAIELNPQRVESYLSLGRFYMSRENPKEAEKTFQKALQINENSVAAHIDYARFLDFLERANEAEKHYRRAIEIEPANRDSLETLAGFYVSRKKLDRAEEVYNQIANLEPKKPENRIVVGDFYAATGREDDAVRVYLEILNERPDFVLGRARLGEILLRREDKNGANAQAVEILKRNGRDVAGLLLRARIRLREGDAQTAVKDLQEVLKQEPSNKLGLYFMADAQLRAGNIEQARDFIVTLERFHPEYLYSRQLSTQISFAAGEPETALRQSGELLNRLKNAKPSKGLSERDLNELKLGALTSRGLANLQLGKIKEARADLEAAQKAAPNSPAVYMNLAKVSLKANNLNEAVGFYNRALALDANNFDALSGLINARVANKQFAEAHNLVDQKLNQNGIPQNFQAALLFIKSNVFTAENKTAEAENALNKAIETDAGYLPAYFAYAALLSSQNQVDRAIEKYRTALEKKPNDANIYALIGLLEDGRGNVDAAIENYQKALKLNPNHTIAANNLGWLYATHDKGNLDEATALAQKLTERFPNEAGYADTLGWIFYKKGANDLALAQFRRAVALEQQAAARDGRKPNAAYRVRLGMALAAAGDKGTARREVETALQNSRTMTEGEIQEAKSVLANLN